MGQVKNRNGVKFDFKSATYLMNDKLRVMLKSQMPYCTEQEFFSAYEILHETDFGEVWELTRRK